MSDPRQRLPVQELLDALRRHASAMESDVDPLVAIPVIHEVRVAALAYVEAVSEHTGWGDVFADLHEDELDDDEPDDDEPFHVEPGTQRLTLTGRWDFVVRDAAALQDLAAQRLRADNPRLTDTEVAEHSDTAVAALLSLLELDEVGHYVGLEEAGSGMSVKHADRTLFEMPDDERSETGF